MAVASISVATLLLLYCTADTCHSTELYRRPPLPYEAVASNERLVHDPKKRGALTTIVGPDGFTGSRVTTVELTAVGLRSHAATPFVQ